MCEKLLHLNEPEMRCFLCRCLYIYTKVKKLKNQKFLLENVKIMRMGMRERMS